MREERTITDFRRVPYGRLSWPAIFGGTFFAFGILLILSFFGLAVGAAASGAQGATHGVGIWAGIWGLVIAFVSFFAGGWLAGKGSTSQTKSDGRLHGLVVWGLGLTALVYFTLNSTERLAGIAAGLHPHAAQANVPAGSVEGITVAAATWVLIAAILGLIGGLLGGHAGGGYRPVAAEEVRRTA